MEYFILMKENTLTVIPADRKRCHIYQKQGYRFLEKTASINEKTALQYAKRKYKLNKSRKYWFIALFTLMSYWFYYIALLSLFK